MFNSFVYSLFYIIEKKGKQLYLSYNDKEKSNLNLYKSRSLSRMVARGRRLCGRKPEKAHMVEQVTT